MAIHECFPYLRVSDGRAAIDFYLELFGGKELFRLIDPENDRVGHAEIELGPGMILMVSDAYPEMGIHAPTGGDNGVGLHLHVDDCDAMLAKAVAMGGTLTRPASDAFYGERSGKFRDPYGHEWMIGHSIEQVEPAEMQRRWDAMVSGS